MSKNLTKKELRKLVLRAIRAVIWLSNHEEEGIVKRVERALVRRDMLVS